MRWWTISRLKWTVSRLEWSRRWRKDQDLRIRAIEALGSFEDKRCIDPLLKEFSKASDPRVEMAAILALSRLRFDALSSLQQKEWRDLLFRAASSPGDGLAEIAIREIARLGNRDYIQRLYFLLEDGREPIVIPALKAILEYPDERRSYPTILRLMYHSSSAVREIAVRGLLDSLEEKYISEVIKLAKKWESYFFGTSTAEVLLSSGRDDVFYTLELCRMIAVENQYETRMTHPGDTEYEQLHQDGRGPSYGSVCVRDFSALRGLAATCLWKRLDVLDDQSLIRLRQPELCEALARSLGMERVEVGVPLHRRMRIFDLIEPDWRTSNIVENHLILKLAGYVSSFSRARVPEACDILVAIDTPAAAAILSKVAAYDGVPVLVKMRNEAVPGTLVAMLLHETARKHARDLENAILNTGQPCVEHLRRMTAHAKIGSWACQLIEKIESGSKQ